MLKNYRVEELKRGRDVKVAHSDFENVVRVCVATQLSDTLPRSIQHLILL